MEVVFPLGDDGTLNQVILRLAIKDYVTAMKMRLTVCEAQLQELVTNQIWTLKRKSENNTDSFLCR